MPTFPDLSRFEQELAGEPLVLPIDGREYTFTANIPADTGLTITRLREETLKFTMAMWMGERPDPNRELLDDASEAKLIKELIGDDNMARMKADGLKWPAIERAGKTLIAWHLYGAERALATWTGGQGDVDPPAQGPETGRRKNSRRTSTTSGTSSTGKKPKPRPRRSGGRTS